MRNQPGLLVIITHHQIKTNQWHSRIAIAIQICSTSNNRIMWILMLTNTEIHWMLLIGSRSCQRF
ncbi:MAG: hypothetical protein MHMPM18_002893 [Marteilia pararefringens]